MGSLRLVTVVLLLLGGAFAHAAEGDTFTLPSGRLVYCFDKNIYQVIANRVELLKREYPTCPLREWAELTNSGALILSLGQSSASCGTEAIHIPPSAGCTF